MKKIVTLLIAAAVGFSVLPAAACADKTERTSYKITAEYDATNGILTADCTVNYYNAGSSTEELKFNLYGNAYREGALYKPVSDELSKKAYYNGSSYGGMEVTEVDGASSWSVGGEDENILEVKLEKPLESGKCAEITISYSLTLAEVNHRTGITKHTVNLGNFYPSACVRDGETFLECAYYSDGDPFVSDCADYMVEITVPAGYTVAAGGQLCGNSGNTYSYSLENARDFAMVLSDEFKKTAKEVDGVDVAYYYYDDENAEKKLETAVESLEWFEDTFGDYSYPCLAVVQTGFAAGGMEYPALTMINGGLSDEEATYAIVHENAHQWWYAMAGSDQINCAWQDEGLAEYSSLMFFESHPDYGFTRTGLINAATQEYRAYFSVYNQIFGNADTTMTRHLKDFVSDYEYVNIAYNKSLIMFDTLRTSIGDDRFVEGLKNYFASANGRRATREELISSFRSTGVDVDGFFESFIEGKIIL